MKTYFERIDIWIADPGEWPEVLDQLGDEFADSSEPERLDNIKLPHRRHEFLVSRIVLSKALAAVGEDAGRIVRDSQGKPVVMGDGGDPGRPFNLSYSQGLLVCAVGASFPLGVDVESVDREISVAPVVKRYFAPPEQITVLEKDGAARQEAFFSIWTLKEAFLKGLGTGLRTSVLSCVFQLNESGGLHLGLAPDVAEDGAQWQLALLKYGAFRVAVASRSGVNSQLEFRLHRIGPGGVIESTPYDPIYSTWAG